MNPKIEGLHDQAMDCAFKADLAKKHGRDERQEAYWVKDLRKVKRRGEDLRRVLVVDDSPEKTPAELRVHFKL